MRNAAQIKKKKVGPLALHGENAIPKKRVTLDGYGRCRSYPSRGGALFSGLGESRARKVHAAETTKFRLGHEVAKTTQIPGPLTKFKNTSLPKTHLTFPGEFSNFVRGPGICVVFATSFPFVRSFVWSFSFVRLVAET